MEEDGCPELHQLMSKFANEPQDPAWAARTEATSIAGRDTDGATTACGLRCAAIASCMRVAAEGKDLPGVAMSVKVAPDNTSTCLTVSVASTQRGISAKARHGQRRRSGETK